jgi:predicted HTH transcriptional regulator
MSRSNTSALTNLNTQGYHPRALNHLRTLRQKLGSIYPPIDYTTRVLTDGGKEFLCVIVAGSPNRPHSAGPAYVRVGSETVNASRDQFDHVWPSNLTLEVRAD